MVCPLELPCRELVRDLRDLMGIVTERNGSANNALTDDIADGMSPIKGVADLFCIRNWRVVDAWFLVIQRQWVLTRYTKLRG